MLEDALLKIRNSIQEGLSELLIDEDIGRSRQDVRMSQRNLFRVRITEFRVKDYHSLFRAILQDGDVDFNNAFEPGKVHDLLGIRIVCHNLCDLDKIVDQLNEIEDIDFVRGPSGFEKNYVENPHDSGYRGWHLQLKKRIDGRSYHAEVQIRTLLQDAWASFMHDDVYKQGLLEFSPIIHKHFSRFSSMLFAVDQMADDLRQYVESRHVSEGIKIKALEAFLYSMNALWSFVHVKHRAEANYVKVYRVDHYTVAGSDGIFDFHIEATQGDGTRNDFTFVIVGDSPENNCELISIEAGGKQIEKDKITIGTIPSNRYAKQISVKTKSKVHKFDIKCKWRGVFENPIEYIWSPWQQYYPNARVRYQLKISFHEPPRLPPKVFELSKLTSGLSNIIENFAEGGKGGIEMNNPEGKYEFTDDDLVDNLITLFGR